MQLLRWRGVGRTVEWVLFEVESIKLHRPQELAEVAALLDDLGEDARVHAGGTDLMVQMRAGTLKIRHVVDLSRVPDLRHIRELSDGSVRIGAAATMTDVHTNQIVGDRFPGLAEGARHVGSQQIQNRATLVGNVCNASPAADTVPPLHVHEAQVNIASQRGSRSVPIAAFATGPRSTCLKVGEWVTSIDLPESGAGSSAYEKLGRTRGVDLAVVGVACRISRGGARFAFASVAPTVTRAPLMEAALAEAGEFNRTVSSAVEDDISPIDDIRASALYRRRVAPLLAERAWLRALGRAER